MGPRDSVIPAPRGSGTGRPQSPSSHPHPLPPPTVQTGFGERLPQEAVVNVDPGQDRGVLVGQDQGPGGEEAGRKGLCWPVSSTRRRS